VSRVSRQRNRKADRNLPSTTWESVTGEVVYRTMVPICLSSASSRMVRKMLAIMMVPLEK